MQNVLGEAFRLTIESLLKENEEVPVKVEAAIALQMMLSSQVIFVRRLRDLNLGWLWGTIP